MNAIACIDKERNIGYKNELLFHIKDDMKYFKGVTDGCIVIMGRKTWDSFPKKPLKNRINIVITNQDIKEKYEKTYFIKYEELDDLLNKLYKNTYCEDFDTFVIGGSTIYELLLPRCNYLYLTEVNETVEKADSKFPEFLLDFHQIQSIPSLDNYYAFNLYQRNNITKEL